MRSIYTDHLTRPAVTILTAADEIGWGKPAGSATVAATIHGDSSKATVFGYDTNDTMSTGTAPARRVGLWMYRVSDNLINTDGWDFFDAAVNWAANITGGSTGSTNIMWSYPNLQGSIAAQADDTGTQTSGTHIYTPDGVPTAGGLPDTRPGEMDDTWLGSHQRPLEHATGLQPVIEMGARQYHPILARFLQVDPIEGGVLNDYGYVADPINQTDLTGECCLKTNPDGSCWGSSVYHSATGFLSRNAGSIAGGLLGSALIGGCVAVTGATFGLGLFFCAGTAIGVAGVFGTGVGMAANGRDRHRRWWSGSPRSRAPPCW